MENNTYHSTVSVDTISLPSDRLCIYKLAMSRRLFNVLERNKIYYLSEISLYSYEEIMGFRNIGIKTYGELQELCRQHNVALKKPVIIPPIPAHLKEIGLPVLFLSECVKNGIFSLKDMNGISTNTLYHLCNDNYILTHHVYQSLRKMGVSFGTWEDSYLFEHLSVRYVMRLWECFHITTVSQLLVMDMKTISGAHGIGQKGIIEIDNFKRHFKR